MAKSKDMYSKVKVLQYRKCATKHHKKRQQKIASKYDRLPVAIQCGLVRKAEGP